MNTGRFHGLTISSPYSLGHPVSGAPDPDIVVTASQLAVVPEWNDEITTIAQYEVNGARYVLGQEPSGSFVFRFVGIVDFRLDADLRRVEVCGWPDAEQDRVPLFLGGAVVSAVLMLHGSLVLHASAIESEGRAMAFVGDSGSGKSTLSALACLAGALLVTDDVLRVSGEEGEMECFRGAHQLRIRPGSSSAPVALAALADEAADGRLLFQPEPTELDRLPLASVFLPQIVEPERGMSRRLLSPKDALFTLLRYPRVQNWTHPSSGEHLGALADLVGRVPVEVLEVPRGLGSDDESLARLQTCLALPGPAQASNPD